MPDEMPLTLVRSVTREASGAISVARSPFTAGQQVQDWGGEWWSFDVEFATHIDAKARTMAGFFVGLRGPVTTFLFRDPSIVQTVVGTPRVSGAAQAGRMLVTSGWVPSSTVMRAGEFIQLGSGDTARLHQVLADSVSNGAGVATLLIWPKLRTSPVNGSAVVVDKPAALVRLVRPFATTIVRPVKAQFSVQMVEAL